MKEAPKGRILPNINRYPLGGLPKPRLPRRIESTFSLEDGDELPPKSETPNSPS